MKVAQILMLAFAIMSSDVLAYGSSSSSKKACKKPRFSAFNPPHLAVVPPRSDFSFIASSITRPDSIKVTIKKQPVKVAINEQNNKYRVSGTLPAEIQGSHVRINIQATGTNRCKGSGGWLLKVQEN